MGLIEQLLAITRNTFFESIRQPIMLVLLMIATMAIVMSNPLSAYTMSDDQQMMIGLGLATVFLCGALLAALVSANVLTREIENKTALTVVSKPVGRPLFIIGKFLGVAAAITLGTLYMSLVFLIVEMHSVLETARDAVHVPVILFGCSAMILGVLAAVWCNYFYNMVFASTVVCITTPLLAIAYVLAMMFAPDFRTQSMSISFRPDLWQALIAMTSALFVLAAVAIAASTRLSQVMTLVITMGAFLIGLLSNWMFGQRVASLESTWLGRAKAQGLTTEAEISRQVTYTHGEVSPTTTSTIDVFDGSLTQFSEDGEQIGYLFAKFGASVTPNFDAMLLTDAVTQEHVIPGGYVWKCLIYALCFIVAFLSLATIMFQRREIG